MEVGLGESESKLNGAFSVYFYILDSPAWKRICSLPLAAVSRCKLADLIFSVI